MKTGVTIINDEKFENLEKGTIVRKLTYFVNIPDINQLPESVFVKIVNYLEENGFGFVEDPETGNLATMVVATSTGKARLNKDDGDTMDERFGTILAADRSQVHMFKTAYNLNKFISETINKWYKNEMEIAKINADNCIAAASKIKCAIERKQNEKFGK